MVRLATFISNGRANYIGIAVIVAIIIFDMVVYIYQVEKSSDTTLPICYPSEKVKSDSWYFVK